MKDMILFPEDIDRLNVILEQLAAKANLLLAVLINKDGRLLTYQGSLDKIDTVSMAALVAGNSASTLAIANLMGETEFSAMYHQGKDRHIFIAVVDENTFLCLVFDDRTNIDRVKVFARQFDRQIKSALKQVYDKTEDQVDLDLDMGAPGQHSAPQDSHGFFQAVEQQSNLIKPEPVSGPFSPSPTDAPVPSASSQKASNVEEEAFFIENQIPPGDRIVDDAHDTNYLYLKKKIRETVNRKKEQ
ncbi:MAG: roadblock/LC7 domain-containing protein [Chitinispirillaceae bacterium]|nr:roadblock/LC7 domain-containing protein [Chitinispirillaceae bacterium]